MNKKKIINKMWKLEQLIGSSNFSCVDKSFESVMLLKQSQRNIHEAYDVIIEVIKELSKDEE